MRLIAIFTHHYQWIITLRKISKILSRTILAILLLVVLLYSALHLTPVQNWLVKSVAIRIANDLHTTVKLDHIDFRFFNKMELKGLLIADKHKDTLLAAGSANVRITDWFFFKDHATLEYIALNDAVVNMQRTDSVWNYQFLLDYFTSPQKKKQKAAIQFDLKELQLSNIRFNQKDYWVGKDMIVSIKRLSLLADKIDMAEKLVKISSIQMDEPQFLQSDYTGVLDRLNRPAVIKKIDSTVKAYRWNNDGWRMTINEFQINNGGFISDKETPGRQAYRDQLDGRHLSFQHINANFKNLHFEKDTLSADIQFATKERSGFEVKKLKAAFRFTPEMMEFKNLDLITNKSKLRDYYAMHFKNFKDDMNEFMHNVTMDANFINSELNSDDLSFFSPSLKSWKKIFSFSGTAKGSVDNLSVRKMLIRTGNSLLDGNITLKGLPDIDNTFIDFTANNLQTNYTDLAILIPSLKNIQNPQLSKLGNIKYKGNYTGFINDFVAFGTINTNLGMVTGDINLKLVKGRPPVYLGKLSTENFNLGSFLNSSALGAISFNGKLNGSGFTPATVNANFDGNVRSVHFADYTYQNIYLKGDFKQKLFSGTARITDPNLKVEYLKGSIDLNAKEPRFKFEAELTKADFKKLKLTNKAFQLKGNFNLDFTGNNIDNFLGSAKITHASLMNDTLPLSFDSLLLVSQIVDGKKYLGLHSNEVDAEIAGNFTINELPDAFNVFLNRYFPAYIKRPSYNVSNQDFSFEIKTKQADQYIRLLDKKLKGFDYSTFSGTLKLKENLLDINADVPEFSYDGRLFTNTRLRGTGSLDSLSAKVDVEDIAINDSLHLPYSKLVFSSRNDTSHVSIKTSASKTLSNAAIEARLVTMGDGVKIHFFPSSFIVNDKKWQLEKDGEIALLKQVSASEVKFSQGNQQIIIGTEPSASGNYNDIVVELTKVNVDDFTPYIFTQPRLEGTVTGTVRIEDPFGKPFIEYQARIDEFKTDGDSIGVVNASGNYNITSGVATFKAASENEENDFAAEGTINTKDSTGHQIDIGFKSDKLNLGILNNYLNGIFSDIRGSANTSDFRIKGSGEHMLITGTANITDASLKVNFTQCTYSFKNETILFNEDEIDLGKIILKDTLNNTATLSGKMYHRFFKNFEFDNLNFESSRLLVLNTTKKDNSQFFGKVIGNASMTLNGPVENMRMNITGEPSRQDSSHIYIISGNSVESGVIDYIDFVQFGTQMENFKSKSSTNIVVNMALTANPSCKIDVILDEATGDVIKGVGNGLLRINVGNKEPLSIDGRYEIERGEYTFNFQTVLNKYFTVRNGGSIVWNGDPYQAKIDITAEYLATKVNFSNLSFGTAATNNYQQRSDLRVVAHLTETLLKPAIDFEFQLPAGSPITDFLIVKRLEQFKNDKNDLNKQVTSLLLFNSFINNNQGFLAAGSGINVLSNTIGGIVSAWVSGFFNSFLQKYVKNLSFNFDANSSYESDFRTNVARVQAAAKSNFVYTLLNGRLIITAGLNLDYNNPYVTSGRNNNILVTPDITAEWILTKDGKVRIVGFNRTNYDLIGQRNRTGISLSYRRDFEKISRIFSNALFFEKAQ